MHELSIAVNIVEVAEQQLRAHRGERVRAIHLRIGCLAGVAKDALLFSFALASEGTAVGGSKLVFEDSQGQELDIVQMEIEP